jgi:hypothetical protein
MDTENAKFEPIKIISAVASVIILVAAIALHFSGGKVESSVLWLIGIGIVLGLIPWLNSLTMSTDGVHITMRDATEGSTKIVNNLMTNAEKTSEAIQRLQSQIDAIAEISKKEAPGLITQIAEDKRVVGAATAIVDAVSAASREIYKTFMSDETAPVKTISDEKPTQPSPHP